MKNSLKILSKRLVRFVGNPVIYSVRQTQKDMALTHLKSERNERFTICGRQRSGGFRRVQHLSTVSEDTFIKIYVDVRGKGMCSKCANVLIEQGKLIAAENTITASEKELIQKLTAGMKDLHDAYIVATKKYAKATFAGMQNRVSWTMLQWYEAYGVKTEVGYSKHGVNVPAGTEGAKEYIDVDSKEYNGKRLYKMRNKRSDEAQTVNDGFEKYETAEINAAERHFSNSIDKLAYRIREKSLNIEKMKISNNSSIRGNGIDTTITDGTNVVNAWTIIAEGPINRPHYRYLVK